MNSDLKPMSKMIGEYADALAKGGIGGPEALTIREKFAHDPEFIAFADSLDRIKRNLEGRPLVIIYSEERDRVTETDRFSWVMRLILGFLIGWLLTSFALSVVAWWTTAIRR